MRFLVADSLTGRVVGQLRPGEWEYKDPLIGQAEGSLRIPLPDSSAAVARLAELLQPHRRQVLAVDEVGRYWFGGPILTDPARSLENVLTVPFSDWRAWFYATTLRPNTDGSRRDYIKVKNGQVEQCQAFGDLANIALDTAGAPKIVVGTVPDSEVKRDVTFRMFKVIGEAFDNISQRDEGPDWWTDLIEDPADPGKVIARLRIGWPERSLTPNPLALRYVVGDGGNLRSFTWPRRPVPPSRVIGIGPTPPPGEEYAIAEAADLEDGGTLAWDEVWQLPEGTASQGAAFDHTYARLEAHAGNFGVVEAELRPDATDLGSWGPGDRARLVVRDGWRDVDIPDARIIGRTLSGRGGHVTGVKVSVDLTATSRDIAEPEETTDETTSDVLLMPGTFGSDVFGQGEYGG